MLPLTGVALLAVLSADVFLTVFSPHGRGGPVNRRQNRVLWALFRAVVRRGPPGERWLALAAPLMVVTTLAVWVTWLVFAFTLVYYPWIRSFLVSPGSLRAPWMEALYYSGYTAATLGLGDLVASTETLRIATVVQAFGGFALLSISVTYFLAIYRELIAMQSLAEDVAALFGDGVEPVRRFSRTEGDEAIARWCERISSGLSRVLLAHFQYPVLHYFRPPKESRALPVQLGALLRLRDALTADDPSGDGASLGRHPSYRALMNSLTSYLEEIDELFVPGRMREGGSATGDAVDRAHDRLLRYMLYR